MPTDDPRLEQALLDAAPPIDSTGVFTRVATRRTRRRRNRRLATGALALVVLLVLGTITVLVTRDDGSSTQVASPGARLRARVITGGGDVGGGAGSVVAPRRVTLDADAQLLSEPMLVGATALSIASYDPGPDGVALSHVVRVSGSHVIDVVDLKAHILSIAEGEGARWVLTQNLRATGGTVPDAFLKRIDGSSEPQSVQLPLNSDPVGPIAAVGGAVWVPVRDGVLQYAPDGAFVGKVPLSDADHRWVAQAGKLAYATDGRVLRSLPVTGGPSDTIRFGPEIIGLAAAGFDSRMLLVPEDGGREHARVTRTLAPTPEVTATLPGGFETTGLAASTNRIWATGTVDDESAIVLLDDVGVHATVVLENATEGATLAWVDAHTVRAVSDGKLYEIRVR